MILNKALNHCLISCVPEALFLRILLHKVQLNHKQSESIRGEFRLFP